MWEIRREGPEGSADERFALYCMGEYQFRMTRAQLKLLREQLNKVCEALNA